MTPSELRSFLATVLGAPVRHAVMIWGPPGVGKSSVVAQAAEDAGLELIDVRLSQLAPTDLRGLPVAIEGISTWYPPEFLPRSGRGVLFLDELNMAAPTMQGVAQQLILDRRVGSYVLPDGWFVWAAGNRKEDRASVFEMPAPLANRFLHVNVEPDLDSFREHAGATGVDERIVAFLAFRPTLLHAMDTKQPAWPSPRSWVMANALLRAGLPIEAAVGESTADEYEAFVEVYELLPSMDAILEGASTDADAWPEEPSLRYALTLGLARRAGTAARAVAGLRWLIADATPEWVQLYAADVAGRLRAQGQLGALAVISREEPSFAEFVRQYRELTGHGAPGPVEP